VLEALRPATETATARHPDSDQWERTYGKPVPGCTAVHQYNAVLRWYQRDQRDTAAITSVLWGSRQHTAIEQGAGSRAISDDWPAQMAEALRAFTTVAWPRVLLARSAGRKHARDD
jgi:hypothetical protein